MSDLREQLSAVLLAHRHVDLLACACGWGPAQRSDADLAAHQSDAALVVFADWLRERAAGTDEGMALAREEADADPLNLTVRLAGAALMGAGGALRTAADAAITHTRRDTP